ncbi:hypothetical protein [Rhodococcus opacus]|uniref:hypothetical protein n=2 Tax=Rhodococcus opacus TaxID=37919 RepID=UPI000A7C5732|nr:hypothetical protein [Rhodococcus opacus]CAG7642521.1 hypothetical protein E143388_08409 [Rhodococcus opacus]
MSTDSDQTPPWATDTPLGAERFGAENTLRMLSKVLKALSGTEDFDRGGALSDKCNAVRTFCINLRDQLFERSTLLVDPETGAKVRRYAVEYVRRDLILELSQLAPTADELVSTGQLDSAARTLLTWLDRLTSSVSHGLTASKLSFAEEFLVFGTAAEESAVRQWLEDLRRLEEDFKESLEATKFSRIAEQAALETIQARDSAKQAAGVTGNTSLAGHFTSLATSEESRAFKWTLTAIAGFVAALAIGVGVLTRDASAVWTSMLSHLTLTLPALAVAAYAARISGHHRTSALWAKTTAVQLSSLSAFLEQMPNSTAREQIVLTLGLRVFAAPDLRDSATEQVSVVPANLTETLKEIAQALRDKAPGPSA